MLTKEQMRIKLEHILKVINQIDNDLVLEQSEKESLLNEAVVLLKQ